MSNTFVKNKRKKERKKESKITNREKSSLRKNES